ncbi:MAG: hypothetical protein IKK79_02605 [Spirochaetaceae bacterium]|nr:hypothetical protein [Spirochaetaceae bacterium]
MNLIDISRQKAEEFFPDETWIEIYRNVYMAAGRKPVNSEREAGQMPYPIDFERRYGKESMCI